FTIHHSHVVLGARLLRAANAGARLLEAELRGEAVVVPARPLLGDAAVLDAEDRESRGLRLPAGLAVLGAHRQARGRFAVAAHDVLDVVVDAVERARVALDPRGDGTSVLVLRAGERVDVPGVVVCEEIAN